MEAYSFLKSPERCPIIGCRKAVNVFSETWTGPGIKSFMLRKKPRGTVRAGEGLHTVRRGQANTKKRRDAGDCGPAVDERLEIENWKFEIGKRQSAPQ